MCDERVAQLGLADAVLLAVGGRDHAVHRGGGERAGGAVVGRQGGGHALVAGVLQLLDADGHRDVVRTGRDRVRRLPQRLRAGGAVVLDPADRLALELERLGQA